MRSVLARPHRATRRRTSAEPAPRYIPTDHIGVDGEADPADRPDADPDRDRGDWLAAEGASEGLNADHAARYGNLHSGYEQALEQYAAARQVLPDLPPAVTVRVSALQERQGRPITLAELRWLQHDAGQPETATDPQEQR